MEKAGSGRPRLLLLLAVLAGLFLMHGMSASAAGGCHGGMPVRVMTPAHPMPHAAAEPAEPPGASAPTSPTSMSAMSSMPSLTTAPVAMTAGPRLTGPAMGGETCVPLRPDEFGGLAIALQAIVLWRMGDPRAAPPIRALSGRPHGPPRRGIDVINEFCVCRT